MWAEPRSALGWGCLERERELSLSHKGRKAKDQKRYQAIPPHGSPGGKEFRNKVPQTLEKAGTDQRRLRVNWEYKEEKKGESIRASFMGKPAWHQG